MTNIRPNALVTGGSRGLGRAIALHLASQGWDLTISARDPERLASVKSELESHGGTVNVVTVGKYDQDSIERIVGSHEDVFGEMNALILSAGVGPIEAIDSHALWNFDMVFGVNVRTTFFLVSRALPLLRKAAKSELRRTSRIVALSSIEALYPDPELAAYSAAKAALNSMLRSINAEESATGVTATALCPAYVTADYADVPSYPTSPDSAIMMYDVVNVLDLILRLSSGACMPEVVINRRGASPYSG